MHSLTLVDQCDPFGDRGVAKYPIVSRQLTVDVERQLQVKSVIDSQTAPPGAGIFRPDSGTADDPVGRA